MPTLFEDYGNALSKCPECGTETAVTARREIFFPTAPDGLFGDGPDNASIMENESTWEGTCPVCGTSFETGDVWNESWKGR
jgi:rRNA maturation protein Nop10